MSEARAATGDGTPDRRNRALDDLRHDTAGGASVGARAIGELADAAKAQGLEVVPTHLEGGRVLLGHVLGMHRCLPAGHLHGPREAPVLLYLFADALAVRPTDDAPMSTVPVLGLHMVLPPLAVARWLYKAGRIEHANLDLVKDAQRFADSLPGWTVDDFADADDRLDVHRTVDATAPVHVYEHLGFTHVWLPPGSRLTPAPRSEAGPTRLKSALPTSSEAFVKLWRLFSLASWPHGVRTDPPRSDGDGE